MIDVAENQETSKPVAADSIQVWLLEIVSLPKTTLYECVFLHKRAGQAAAGRRAQGHTSTKLRRVWAESISKDRVIYERTVFHLDKSNGEREFRRQALSKLDPEEIEALGLVEQAELDLKVPSKEEDQK